MNTNESISDQVQMAHEYYGLGIDPSMYKITETPLKIHIELVSIVKADLHYRVIVDNPKQSASPAWFSSSALHSIHNVVLEHNGQRLYPKPLESGLSLPAPEFPPDYCYSQLSPGSRWEDEQILPLSAFRIESNKKQYGFKLIANMAHPSTQRELNSEEYNWKHAISMISSNTILFEYP